MARVRSGGRSTKGISNFSLDSTNLKIVLTSGRKGSSDTKSSDKMLSRISGGRVRRSAFCAHRVVVSLRFRVESRLGFPIWEIGMISCFGN